MDPIPCTTIRIELSFNEVKNPTKEMVVVTGGKASLVAQLVKNPPAMQETRVRSWVGKIFCRRDRLPTPVLLGFPGGSAGKESSCNV